MEIFLHRAFDEGVDAGLLLGIQILKRKARALLAFRFRRGFKSGGGIGKVLRKE